MVSNAISWMVWESSYSRSERSHFMRWPRMSERTAFMNFEPTPFFGVVQRCVDTFFESKIDFLFYFIA